METRNMYSFILNDIEYIICIKVESNKIRIESKEKENEDLNLFENNYTIEDLKNEYNIFNNMDNLEEIKIFLEDILSKKEFIKLEINEKENYMTIIFEYNLGPLKKNIKIKLLKKVISANETIEYLKKKIKMLKEENLNLKNIIKINGLSLDGKKDDYGESNLITNEKEINLIKSGIFNINNKKLKLKLIYRASRDGDNPKDFHSKCDGIEPTISIFKTTNGFTFGGYTDKGWDNKSSDLKTSNTFLFSFNNKKIYPGINGGQIYCSSTHGPWFSYALGVLNNNFLNHEETNQFEYNSVKAHWNNFNKDYELTGGIKNYKVMELEVFKVEFI